MYKILIISFMFVCMSFSFDVVAGNPAPLYDSPVHLGGANPNYGKKKKKKVESTEVVAENKVEEENKTETVTPTEPAVMPTTQTPTQAPSTVSTTTEGADYDF